MSSNIRKTNVAELIRERIVNENVLWTVTVILKSSFNGRNIYRGTRRAHVNVTKHDRISVELVFSLV